MAMGVAVGRYGESVAVRHLQEQGMTILARNWRSGRLGEVDIVAADGDCLVVCEVKTRRGSGCGGPLDAVTPRKVARLRRLAGAWLQAQPAGSRAWSQVRIDVVGVRPQPRGAAVVEHVRAVGA
ncbi:MAG: YraN family protein [Kineosporiaceae bacterium]